MIFTEWSSMSEISTHKLEKAKSWIWEKNNSRNSALQMLNKIGVLWNCAKHTEKHLCRSLFLLKLYAPQLAILLKKKLRHKYFPVVTFYAFNLVGVLMLDI